MQLEPVLRAAQDLPRPFPVVVEPRVELLAQPGDGRVRRCGRYVPVFRPGPAPFRAALQIRLGLPVTAVAGRTRCRCGHHALSCNHDEMTFRRHQAVLRALERLYAWTNVTRSRNLHNDFPHLHGGDPDLRALRADLKAPAVLVYATNHP